MSDHDNDVSAVEVTLPSEGRDDIVVPFHTEKAGARGRLVRLGSCVDQILTDHNYPDPVANFLGEAIALTALIGTSLKFDGKLILQTKSDGPISMLVVDFSTPSALRAYASFDAGKVQEMADAPLEMKQWLGKGYMALTVDQGPEMERYQGIVEMEGETLGDVAEKYFMQSEQIPSLVRLHTAKHFQPSDDSEAAWQWRSGGVLVQYLTSQGGVGGESDVDELNETQEEDWRRARILGDSVEVHELLDPQLEPERLLFRLYHEEGVRVFEAQDLEARCSCSRERVKAMLGNFSSQDRESMVEEGKISVTCEFCTRRYEFSMQDFG